jgi:MFS family permease
VGGRLGVRFNARVPILLGLGLSIAAFALLSRIDKDMQYTDLLPGILLLGTGAGLCVTAMNAAPMNAIPARKAGEAAGILQMTTGLGAVLGIALGGALFQEMHERRLTDFLRAARGHSIPESTQHHLTGLLVHSPPAERALARFDTQTADTIVRGIREAFVYGVSSTMWLSAGALCAGVVAAIALLRRGSLTVSS